MSWEPGAIQRQQDDDDLLAVMDEEEKVAYDYIVADASLPHWSPATPSPPPLYSNRNASTFIPRAPSRIVQPAGQPGGGQNPVQQDRRLTRQGETVQIVLNGLLRNGDIIRIGSMDFRLSWIPPEYAGSAAPIGTIFLDTTTGLLSMRDINGVVIPIGTGGSISFDFGGA